MNHFGKHIFTVVCAFVLVTGAFFINPTPIFSQENNPVTTEVTHEPIDYFVPGNRIQLDAEVTDDDGIELVRCYFKAQGEADFVFVKTEKFKKNDYRAILPSPAAYTDTIEYLFLVVNKNKQVVKTQVFQINKDDAKDVPDWQEVSSVGSEGDIAVYTELSKAPETVPGFSDSISLDIVESSARFGMVSGIYSASAMASTGGSATAATSAGTVTAGAGVSTTTVLAAGTAVAAAAAGTAAAASGGGGGGDEKLNSIASISWGDDDAPVGDAFQVVVGSKDIGANTTNGSIGIKTETGFPVGDSDLIITCISALADEGNYIINLSGGAIFRNDQSTHKEGTLREGESRTYPIHISEVADTTIRW